MEGQQIVMDGFLPQEPNGAWHCLVACEESQAVTKELRELGHIAWSCDLQECSGGHPEWHICGDCVPLLDGNCSFVTQDGAAHTQTGKWDLIIAHPPCTYLSNAGACRMFHIVDGKQCIDAERFKLMQEGREFFIKVFTADCDRIAIENPTPMKICELPEPSQVIQPFDFGHPFSKRTCLWLKGLPELVPTKYEMRWKPYLPSNTSKNAKTEKNKGTVRNIVVQSKTFPGIAKAMAEQWTT